MRSLLITFNHFKNIINDMFIILNFYFQPSSDLFFDVFRLQIFYYFLINLQSFSSRSKTINGSFIKSLEHIPYSLSLRISGFLLKETKFSLSFTILLIINFEFSPSSRSNNSVSVFSCSFEKEKHTF